MPLVTVGAEPLDTPLSDAHGQARQINPIYAEGPLVRVAGGRNQSEAELIQGLLLSEGVPSLLRRSAGFDVPDFLAAGPRDVLVPQTGVEMARELLQQTDPAPSTSSTSSSPSPMAVLAWVAGGGAIAALIAWLLQGGG
jgi:hypothetical protein